MQLKGKKKGTDVYPTTEFHCQNACCLLLPIMMHVSLSKQTRSSEKRHCGYIYPLRIAPPPSSLTYLVQIYGVLHPLYF